MSQTATPEPEAPPLAPPGWLGPLARFDLVRLARRRRSFLLRFLYALFLLLIAWLYFARLEGLLASGTVSQGVLTRLAEGFVAQFFVWQAVAIALFTPAYLGGAVAEERERGTLELLFTTHLTVWELVAGKLLARLMHLFGLLLVGVPVLAFGLLIGGVNPQLLLAQTLVAAGSLCSFGGYSLMKSAQSRTVTQGVTRAYAGVIGFQVGGALVVGMCLCGLPPALAMTSPFAFGLVASQSSMADPLVLGLVYFLAHATAGAAFISKTLRHLRRWQRLEGHRQVLLILPPKRKGEAKGEANGQPEAERTPILMPLECTLEPPDEGAPRSATELLFYPRPQLSERPLLWKELHTGRRYSALTVMDLLLTVTLWTVGGWVLLFAFLVALGPHASELRTVRAFLLGVAAPVVVMVVFRAALRASGSVAQEKAARTWDSLLTLPCPRHHLFVAKGCGAVLMQRRWLIFLAVAAPVMLLTGALHPISWLMLGVLLPIQLAAAVAFGLWVSTIAGSRLAAQMTMAASFFFLVFVAFIALRFGLDHQLLDWLLESLNPLAATTDSAFSWNELPTLDDLLSRLTIWAGQSVLMASLAIFFFWRALRRAS